MYLVMVSLPDDRYAVLEVRGRMSWKTKRTAQKHARNYKATNLRDAWVEETN
jgi:hypothetical protein